MLEVDLKETEEALRKSGLNVLGDVAWGTHFCVFYDTKDDLLDILIPYFKAGLEKNEYCMWITSEPLVKKVAEEALRKAMPDLDQYLKKQQIEILPYTEWYIKDNTFDLQRVLNAWVDKLDDALSRGYEGLRTTGNTAWLEKKDWKSFTEYEEEINTIIPSYKMMAICTYQLEKCGSFEIIDVLRNHQFAMIRREGKWENYKSMEQLRVEHELKESEVKYRNFYNNAEFGLFETSLIDGKLLACNQKLAKMIGYDSIQQFVDEYNVSEHYVDPSIRLRMIKKIKSQGFIENFEGELRDRFGIPRWFSFSGHFHPERESIEGLVIEITERKIADQKLKESEEIYREAYYLANFYKDLFTHDMNNILQNIISSIDLYILFRNEPKRFEKIGDVVEVVKTHARRGAALIANIRKLSKIDNGESKLSIIKIFDIFNESVKTIVSSFQDRNVKIDVKGLSKDMRVLGNELLVDIFDNLLNNAVKYNDNEEEVKIDINISKILANDMHYLKLEFRDYGMGVPNEKKNFLFKRFYKKDISKRGMGVGLSLVKRIVKNFDGKIWVEDRVKGDYKKGANFVVLLKEAP